MMTLDDSHERRRLNQIAVHLEYFIIVCVSGSIGGAASECDVHEKSVTNHIKWVEQLIGRRLIQDVLPGLPAELTAYGADLIDELDADYFKTIRKLDANKKDEVMGEKFTAVIRRPRPEK